MYLPHNVHIYKISEDRFNIVKLSPHIFTAQFKLNICIPRINMGRYNLITMHVLIILRSSCLINISRHAQVNKYGDCYDIATENQENQEN